MINGNETLTKVEQIIGTKLTSPQFESLLYFFRDFFDSITRSTQEKLLQESTKFDNFDESELLEKRDLVKSRLNYLRFNFQREVQMRVNNINDLTKSNLAGDSNE